MLDVASAAILTLLGVSRLAKWLLLQYPPGHLTCVCFLFFCTYLLLPCLLLLLFDEGGGVRRLFRRRSFFTMDFLHTLQHTHDKKKIEEEKSKKIIIIDNFCTHILT